MAAESFEIRVDRGDVDAVLAVIRSHYLVDVEMQQRVATLVGAGALTSEDGWIDCWDEGDGVIRLAAGPKLLELAYPGWHAQGIVLHVRRRYLDSLRPVPPLWHRAYVLACVYVSVVISTAVSLILWAVRK